MTTFAQIVILMTRLSRRTIAQQANRLLSLCIVVCTCVASSLGFFANSVQTALDNDIANYLGAPLVVRSERPLPADLLTQEGLNTPVVTACLFALSTVRLASVLPILLTVLYGLTSVR